VKAQPVAQSLAALRVPRELGEQLHLDCAQECLRGPEAEADLHDLIWGRIFTHVSPSSVVEATPLSIFGHHHVNPVCESSRRRRLHTRFCALVLPQSMLSAD
jgi:hypothetical protein